MGPPARGHPRLPRHGAPWLTPLSHMERAAYGYDAPGIMLGMLLGGTGAALAAALLLAGLRPSGLAWAACVLGLVAGMVPLLGLLMLAYAFVGKRRMRDRMLDALPWTGQERVLDVGTGAGLLLVGAAKRLTDGRAVGIDIWSAKDLSGNTPHAAGRNAAIEGVADRVEVLTGDARRLAFPDGSFDRVLSLLCLHNIEGAADRDAACQEIARVLRPGGIALIGDYVPTHGYAAALHRAGLQVGASQACFGTALSLMWMVRADKPAG